MCADHKINRGQYCDITMSKANAVLGCGLTTTGIFFFLMPSLGHKCLEECHQILLEENRITRESVEELP